MEHGCQEKQPLLHTSEVAAAAVAGSSHPQSVLCGYWLLLQSTWVTAHQLHIMLWSSVLSCTGYSPALIAQGLVAKLYKYMKMYSYIYLDPLNHIHKKNILFCG